jgi:hypothetical protein
LVRGQEDPSVPLATRSTTKSDFSTVVFGERKEMRKRTVLRWAAIAFEVALVSFYVFQTLFFCHKVNLDDRFCLIHHRSTQFGICPMVLGFSAVDEQRNSAKSRLFPLANSYVDGGCVPEDIGYWKWTLFCPECRQAEKDWLENRYKRIR